MMSVSPSRACLAVLGLSTAAVAAEPIRVISWNLESGGATTAGISPRIASMNGVDFWGLSEVETGWPASLETAAESGENADFSRVLGTTGGGDRLLIVYDADRFEKVSSTELSHINTSGTVRAPLVGRFRVKSDGREFFFMVNHLYRGDANARHRQATLLREWAEQQDVPVIAVGDYNFDWSLPHGENDHDLGYDNMTKNGVFTWVRPEVLMATQFSEGSPNRQSVLDFVFVAKAQGVLSGTSEIIKVPNDFPDDNTTPDHRPVAATFVWSDSNGGAPVSVRARLLERIAALESQLAELKAIVLQIDE